RSGGCRRPGAAPARAPAPYGPCTASAPTHRHHRRSQSAPMTAERGKRLTLEHVSKRFVREGQSALAAVDDVTLTVEPGELLTLLGPSGWGKTATLRKIGGLAHPATATHTIGGTH